MDEQFFVLRGERGVGTKRVGRAKKLEVFVGKGIEKGVLKRLRWRTRKKVTT